MDFDSWKEYFTANSNHFEDIRWDLPACLTEEEKALIAPSLQLFQKGEQSEGKHFFAFAKTFPDPTYPETVRLFILEEQTHAAVLGKFMDKEGIPRIRRHWVDGIFRWLRNLIDLEHTVTVLITAEIIAKVYYKALADATSCELLKQICNQILRDEEQHVFFQSHTLNLFFTQKGRFRRTLNRSLHLLLMIGTILIVWTQHKRLLKAGGFSFSRFCLNCMIHFLETDKRVSAIGQDRLFYV
jgi:hypothetical protein